MPSPIDFNYVTINNPSLANYYLTHGGTAEDWDAKPQEEQQWLLDMNKPKRHRSAWDVIGNVFANPIGNLPESNRTGFLGGVEDFTRSIGEHAPGLVASAMTGTLSDLYSAIRTDGDFWDKLDRYSDPGGAIDDTLRETGENMPVGAEPYVTPVLTTIGGIVGTYVPVIGTAAGAAIGRGVAGKLVGEDNESAMEGAGTAFALGSAASAASSALAPTAEYLSGTVGTTAANAATSAVGSAAVNATAQYALNDGNVDPYQVLLAAGTAAGTAAASSLETPATGALSQTLQDTTGMSPSAAGTTAGATTSGLINSATQYATTGNVNPIGLTQAMISGGQAGYRAAQTPTAGALTDNADFADGEIDYNVPGYDTQNPDPNAPVTGMIHYPGATSQDDAGNWAQDKNAFSYLNGSYYDKWGVEVSYTPSTGKAIYEDGTVYDTASDTYTDPQGSKTTAPPPTIKVGNIPPQPVTAPVTPVAPVAPTTPATATPVTPATITPVDFTMPAARFRLRGPNDPSGRYSSLNYGG